MPKKTVPKKQGWKDNKLKLKLSKNLKLGLSVLGVIIVLLVFAQIFSFIKTLITPLSYGTNEKRSPWDGEFNINVVIQSDSTYLLNYNPKGEATVLAIPNETYLSVPGGHGEWMLQSIFELGESSKKGSGYQLLKSSLSNFLGIPIDGFIRFKAKYAKKELREIVEAVRQNPISGMDLISNIDSDLTLMEIIRLKLSLWGVRFDKMNYLELSKLNALDIKKLPDGSAVLVSDPNKLDSVLVDFIDSKIRDENMSIAVFNATEYPLLAQKAKRMITSIGGNVIIVSNSPKIAENSYILGENSKTLKRLNQIFKLCQKDQKCDNMTPDEYRSRAQINIFLGEDFAKINN